MRVKPLSCSMVHQTCTFSCSVCFLFPSFSLPRAMFNGTPNLYLLVFSLFFVYFVFAAACIHEPESAGNNNVKKDSLIPQNHAQWCTYREPESDALFRFAMRKLWCRRSATYVANTIPMKSVKSVTSIKDANTWYSRLGIDSEDVRQNENTRTKIGMPM